MKNRHLAFSSKYLPISDVIITGEFTITEPTILINLSPEPVINQEDQSVIPLLQSRLVSNIKVSAQGAHVCMIENSTNDFLTMSTDANAWFTNNWDRASVLEPHIPELQTINQYKSKIDTLNGYTMNFWYLEKNSQGLIHKHRQTFKEVLTQILGMGMMQKYKEKSHKTVFETDYMIPGYTHYPFYNKEGHYPWHSFNAITNSVFLAITHEE